MREGAGKQYAYTQNRELSWLRFNRRVLEEAGDRSNPPLERLKFTAIFSSNLDEFFMVRVGSLFDIAHMSPTALDNKSGLSSVGQLEKIYETIPGLIALKKRIYASVAEALAAEGVCDLPFTALTEGEQKFINRYFKGQILPILSPIIIGSRHPVPHLVNKQLYAAALLRDKKDRSSLGIVPIPETLPPYVLLPGSDGRFIRTENILLRRMPGLFGSYQVCESCVICVTRNADISFDDEKFDDSEEDFRSRVLKLLKKRDSLSVMRLEISEKISEPFLSSLTALVHVEKRQIYFDSCPLNMKYVYQLAGDLPPQKAQALLYPPYRARWPEDIRPDRGMIEQIKEKDRLLFFPFDAVDPFLRLLSEAAEREDVVSIKISIYRLASSSKIARALCRAAENGKEVVVLMELRARFDEANNISWSKLLEDAGCQVVYGVEDFKCHSKLCLITMREKGRLRYITQVGTGNYNEKTNAMYTDLSLMTASEQIGRDAAAFFRNMLVNNLAGEYKRMLVAPTGIKPALLALIDEQAALGSEGYICVKANAVTEREVIDRLMEASRAGVEIQLIIRGICCILPGVPDYTENVHVTSIVGRYLEHARIYCFGRGEHAKLFISSADFMTRNLNRRVEIACPIEDGEIKAQLLKILQVQLADNAKASFMMSNGVYGRKSAGQRAPLDSQREFMEKSLHDPAPAPAPKTGPGAKIAAFFRKVLA